MINFSMEISRCLTHFVHSTRHSQTHNIMPHIAINVCISLRKSAEKKLKTLFGRAREKCEGKHRHEHTDTIYNDRGSVFVCERARETKNQQQKQRMEAK